MLAHQQLGETTAGNANEKWKNELVAAFKFFPSHFYVLFSQFNCTGQLCPGLYFSLFLKE